MLRLPLLLVAVAAVASFARAQSAWTVTRFNQPNVSAAFGIAYGKGRFIAAVQGGPRGLRLASSVDGITWQDTPVNGGGQVFFFGDAFFHVGGGGVWRSTDGNTWNQIYNHYPENVGSSIQKGTHNGRGMLLDSGLFNGVLIYSADLVSWRRTTLPNTGQAGAQVSITQMGAGAGRYFVSYAVTNPSRGFTAYAASTADGVTWTLVPELRLAQGIAGGNGRLVALVDGQARITTDGTTFTSALLPQEMFNPQRLFFAGGRFFAARTMHASTDGITWARVADINKPDAVDVRGIAYGAGRYVAVGTEFRPPDAVDMLAYLSTAAPPLIANQPASQSQAEGRRAVFSVGLENADVLTTFQWRRDGAVIPGATLPALTLEPLLLSNAGRYSVDVRNPAGAVTSEPAQLTVVPVTEAGRIINLSVLTTIDAASGPDAAFTVGFVVGGTGSTGNKAVLVRAGGPSLTRFGVTDPISDPRVELFGGPVKLMENDNWSGATAISDVAVQVGAFPFLASDSRDAAVFSETLPTGDASVKVSANGGALGTVIAEVYDATPHNRLSAATPRLINVSVLKSIAAGANLSAGFVIGGTTPTTVMIRAVGPGLVPFNLGGTMADPRLMLFRVGEPLAIANNEDWGGSVELRSRFESVGAFNLLATSRDAALLVTLAPGNYVAQASDAAGSGGLALVEIYEVP